MTALRVHVWLLTFVLLPASGFAWGPIGHMAVGYVAYQSLTPATKVRARDLLKLNPDYSSWEKQIPAGTSASDHDMFIFVIATTWADDIKGEPQYSDDGSDGGNTPDGTPSSQNTGYSGLLRHRYWHFVDIPFSADHKHLPSIPVPNAQTQIVAFRAVLASSQPDELKSYDLVWLLHLVGDIHQPLHATTRVTGSDPKGDAGGNRVKLRGDAASNLHSYWDELPGSDCKFCSDKMPCVHRARVFGESLEPVAQSTGTKSDTADWVKESFEYARTEVYEIPIGPEDGPYSIVPWSNYESHAYRLAQKRIALAGSRLAQVLNEEMR